MTRILFVGAEVMPLAATGGLGDVLGSLPAALAKDSDNDVRVVMPLYSAIGLEWRRQMKTEAVFEVKLSWRRKYCGVLSLRRDDVTYYFIDNEYYFKRDSLYGSYDDAERFAFFCMAVPELMQQVGFYPDVMHANDWQAALSVVYLKNLYSWRAEYSHIKTVFTIHNIEYQGQYDFAILGDVFGLSEWTQGLMDWNGCINLMKAAIVSADRGTTVSPKYAQEILTDGHGLEAVLCQQSCKLTGILNGIDYNYYNPETDPALYLNYSAADPSGKTGDKLALEEELSLPAEADVPTLAIISRLASHKGLDLVCEIAYNLIDELDCRLIVLGKGESRYEDFFRRLESDRHDRVRALIQYDRELSRRIYAGADVFVMPSRREPCGLSQMIASRYGAIPVVRETGGLYDSIKGYWEQDGELHGNGFTFANYSSHELYDRIRAALELWRDAGRRERFVRKIMNIDFSWGASAARYQQLYRELTAEKGDI